MNIVKYNMAASGAVAIALMSAGSIGCTPMSVGDAAQMNSARNEIINGRNFLTSVQNDFRTLLNSLAATPIAKALLLPTGVGSQPLVLRSEVESAYGLYTQTSQGGFDVTALATPAIRIKFLNGTEAAITNFVFGNTTLLPNQPVVRNFLFTTKPAATTPVDEQVTITMDATRQTYAFIGNNAAVAEWVELLSPSHVKYKGTLRYQRLGSFVTYSYSTLGTTVRMNTGAPKTLTKITKIDITDETVSSVNPSFYRQSEEIITYEATDTVDTLAATFMSNQYINETFYKQLNPSRVEQKLSITLSKNFENAARYEVSSADGKIAGVTPLFGGFSNYSIATWNRNYVAKPSGGFIDCDLINPGSPGIGVAMELVWIDGVTIDAIMPSQNYFTCKKATILQPSTAPLL